MPSHAGQPTGGRDPEGRVLVGVAVVQDTVLSETANTLKRPKQPAPRNVFPKLCYSCRMHFCCC